MTLKALTVFHAKCFAIVSTLLGLASFVVSAPATAISIDLVTTSQDVTVGDTLALDLFIRDLGDTTLPSVSTFDFNLGFDSTVLDFAGLTFGDPVLGDLVDISGAAQEFTNLGVFDAIGFNEPSSGVVNLFQVSLDFPQDIDTTQPDSFVLASLNFTALNAGINDFDLIVNALGDSLGDPLTLETVESSSIVVTDAISQPPAESIPEPAASWLSFLGFVGLGSWVSKKTLTA